MAGVGADVFVVTVTSLQMLEEDASCSSSVDGDVLFRMPLSMPLEIVSQCSFFKNRVLTRRFHEISCETPGRRRVVVPSVDRKGPLQDLLGWVATKMGRSLGILTAFFDER